MKKIKLLIRYLFTKPWYLIKYTIYLIRKKIHPHIKYKTKDGITLSLNLRNEIDSNLYLLNSFEEYLSAFYKKFLKKDSIFFDIWANIWLYSLIWTTKIKTWHIYSFEPNPKMIKQINESIKINKIKNISIIENGVSNENKIEQFNFANDPAYSSLGLPHKHKITQKKDITLITIDKFISNKKISKLDFIKIDVEWAERSVIEWAKETIKKLKPTFSIEVSDETYKSFKYTSKDLINIMKNLGYSVYNYKKKKLEKEKIKDYYYYDNLIFIHKDRFNLFSID